MLSVPVLSGGGCRGARRTFLAMWIALLVASAGGTITATNG